MEGLDQDALWELSRRVGLDAQIPAFFASLAQGPVACAIMS